MLSEKTAIETMYINGHLGGGTIADRRLAAGLRFINDYHKSEFGSNVHASDYMRTRDKVPHYTDSAVFVTAATERYQGVLEECKRFNVYLNHFLKNEDNVKSFIDKHPKTRDGKKRTYADVYMAVIAMLDKIDAYYQRRGYKWTD